MIVVHNHDNKSSLNMIEIDTTACVDGDLLVYDPSSQKFINTGEIDFKLTPTVNDTAVSLEGHNHDSDYAAVDTNIDDNSIVCGDGGGKGIKGSLWSIDSTGVMSSNLSISGYILDVHNQKSDGGGYGFRIKAGEQLGDIAFHVADRDDTFQIMEMEADQGFVTLGKTYAQTLSDNGVVYGIDIQHPGDAKDFNTQNGVYRIGGNAVMHGTHHQEASSDGETTTTSTSWQQKLRMTTGSLPSGKYRIGWYFEGHVRSSSYDLRVQVEINDTTQLMEHRLEHNDSGSDQYGSYGGFDYYTGSGVLNIDLDYCSSSSSGTAAFRRARLEIWRVS